jgi:hypothetical protein
VRSYYYFDTTTDWRLASWRGEFHLLEVFQMKGPMWTPQLQPRFGVITLYPPAQVSIVPVGEGTVIPYWSVLVLILAMAVTPWLRWRFSLRTLLTIMTLIAILFGTIVYVVS